MHQHLERTSASSATQLRETESLDILKAQRTTRIHEEQRACKNDLGPEHARQDIPLPLHETVLLPNHVSETEALRHELTQRTRQIDALHREHAKFLDGDEAQALKQVTKQSSLIIDENKIEMEQKEVLFHAVHKEIQPLQAHIEETQQRITEIRAYQRALEKEEKLSPHMPTTTYPSDKQVKLLDTAIASLNENLVLEQDIREQKIKDFSEQKRAYQDQQNSHYEQNMHIKDLNTQLSETKASIHKQESELRMLNLRSKEIRQEHDRLQKEQDAPQLVAQNFVAQVSMITDHVHYLEREIETKKQVLEKHQPPASELSNVDQTRSQSSPEIAHLAAELVTLGKDLDTEKKYLKTLQAGKVERAQQWREIELSLTTEIQATAKEISAFEKINALLKREKTILQSVGEMETIQRIDQHLKKNNLFLSDARAYKQTLDKHIASNQVPSAALEAQRNGIYTPQELEKIAKSATITAQTAVYQRDARQKIHMLKEQIATIHHIWHKIEGKEQAKHVVYGERSKPPRKLAATEVELLNTLRQECREQRRTGQKYHKVLVINNERYATQTLVHRPIDAQITMVQNLKQLYQRYEANPDRLIKLETYQQKLEELHTQRQDNPPGSGNSLRKQIAMVKEHIKSLQAETPTTQIATQLAAEQQYLSTLNSLTMSHTREQLVQKLNSRMSSSKQAQSTETRAIQQQLQDLDRLNTPDISAHTSVTRSLKEQLSMLDHLLHYTQAQRDEVSNKLRENKQHRNNLQRHIQQLPDEYLHIYPSRETQKELVAHNLNYLLQQSQKEHNDLDAKKNQENTLKARILYLTDCNRVLAKNALSSSQMTDTDAHTWQKYKNSLQSEIHQRRYNPAATNKQTLDQLQERLRQAYKLDEMLQLQRPGKIPQRTLEVQQKRERLYVNQLDQHRDHLRHMKKNIDASVKENAQSTDEQQKPSQQEAHLPVAEQVQALGTPNAERKKQNWIATLSQNSVNEQLTNITAEIQQAHERLKVIEENRGESTHPFFLEEHMIPQETLHKFGFLPIAHSRVFMGTTESACVPSSIRMICHDHDPGFASRAHEVADTLHTTARGGASLEQVPWAFAKLKHPIPYQTIKLDSIYQLQDTVKFDRHGNYLPSIIHIARLDKDYTHALVCNRIIELNGHSYAVLRDPLLPKAFAIRLDHLNEVLAYKSTIDPISGKKRPVKLNAVIPA